MDAVEKSVGNPIERFNTPASQDGNPIVKYRGVSKSYGDIQVLKDINLDIFPSEKVAVIGPSGSGKTTLARMLMTLDRPTTGTIEVGGQMLWHQAMKGKLIPANEKHLHQIRSHIGMVFQHFNLFPHMTVLGNVTEAPIHVLGLKRADAEQRAMAMLEKVGLADKAMEYPSRLSGGQKQRVAIARAVVMRPKIMLFDEATSALDPELVGEVLSVIKDLAAQRDMAMMLITHEMDFARDIADRILFTDGGSIVEQGTSDQIFGNPQSPRLQSFLSRFRQTWYMGGVGQVSTSIQ
ncbi:ectoine/hydroxyectoine ABC transporter ATP-binding protein EhuA [Paenibacillus oryzisoli]|uniref:Ectoine/hydroxyectoine ABC transporter ATP-binding protein EhuA n=1 Tax=Paenibacillus oryzisoli TaxID=1850517 RepID=A0A198A4T9_9BACL|nr:ectoine/hydroxyectoine ABC transporter ATP-binding protein EhuA [Paenibacillus oryzisoli]OAS16013.1 ectoine/hydroxyectoine ABC transporter ATP-binding protein EhuA [Paenibacillus oryzisoli]